MKIEADRSRRIAFVVGIAVVAFAAGLALALWGPSVGQTIAKAAGALDTHGRGAVGAGDHCSDRLASVRGRSQHLGCLQSAQATLHHRGP